MLLQGSVVFIKKGLLYTSKTGTHGESSDEKLSFSSQLKAISYAKYKGVPRKERIPRVIQETPQKTNP